MGRSCAGVAAATDFTANLANMLSGHTVLALIVASFGVTMRPNLSLTKSAYSVRYALRRIGGLRKASDSLFRGSCSPATGVVESDTTCCTA